MLDAIDDRRPVGVARDHAAQYDVRHGRVPYPRSFASEAHVRDVRCQAQPGCRDGPDIAIDSHFVMSNMTIPKIARTIRPTAKGTVSPIVGTVLWATS